VPFTVSRLRLLGLEIVAHVLDPIDATSDVLGTGSIVCRGNDSLVIRRGA